MPFSYFPQKTAKLDFFIIREACLFSGLPERIRHKLANSHPMFGHYRSHAWQKCILRDRFPLENEKSSL